jgi:hypothetical protein
MELLQRLDAWLALIALAAVAWYLGLLPLIEGLRARRSVNRSADGGRGATSDYVTSERRTLSVSTVPPLVTETETETETDDTSYAPPPGSTETSYIRLTQQQYDQFKARVFLEGAAHAMGTLQGAGYLDAVVSAERLTDAKRAVFGSSGRTLTTANRLIAQAAAKATPAEEDQRLIPVSGGKDGYLEV